MIYFKQVMFLAAALNNLRNNRSINFHHRCAVRGRSLTGAGPGRREINYPQNLLRIAGSDDMSAILGRIMAIFFNGGTFHGRLTASTASAVWQGPVFLRP